MSIFPRNKTYSVTVGMRRSWWAPIVSEPANAIPVYGDVEELGGARLGTLTINTASVDIEGDDKVLRHLEQFTGGTFVGETTEDDLEVNAKMFGHSFESGVEISNENDTAPFGAYGFLEPILKSGRSKPITRATFLLRLVANQANETQNAAARQGGSINPGYKSNTFSLSSCNTGDYRFRKEFEDENEAAAWVLGWLGATETFLVSTDIVGNGSVSPGSSHFFESGQNAVLTFSAAPVALYDNGVDVTSSVSNKKYTISGIAAPHHLVAVFASA